MGPHVASPSIVSALSLVRPGPSRTLNRRRLSLPFCSAPLSGRRHSRARGLVDLGDEFGATGRRGARSGPASPAPLIAGLWERLVLSVLWIAVSSVLILDGSTHRRIQFPTSSSPLRARAQDRGCVLVLLFFFFFHPAQPFHSLSEPHQRSPAAHVHVQKTSALARNHKEIFLSHHHVRPSPQATLIRMRARSFRCS